MQLTENQRRVLTALKEAEKPLGAYALLDQLRKPGFNAPVQIYRALERLVEYGLAHRLDTLNAYVSCSRREDCKQGFKVFAICGTCGHIHEFLDNDLSVRLERLAKTYAFSPERAAIEVRGQCSACANLVRARS